jgi:hypothetical protein
MAHFPGLNSPAIPDTCFGQPTFVAFPDQQYHTGIFNDLLKEFPESPDFS